MSGQAQYSAINSFYSSTSLSLGGAGYLSPNLLSLKNNPSVKNDERIIKTSIINYKNGISSQSFGANFLFKGGNISLSLKNISYGTFDKYDENKILRGKYQSSDNWFTLLLSKKIENFPLRVVFNLLIANLMSAALPEIVPFTPSLEIIIVPLIFLFFKVSNKTF